MFRLATILTITVMLTGAFMSVRITTATAQKRSQQSKPKNVWRGLVPMRSTRADVERLLGPGEEMVSPRRVSYLFKGVEAVMFTYSEGNCARDHGWKLSKDTILSIDIIPHRDILLTELHLDLTDYGKVEFDHPAWFFYTNLDDGLTIRTSLLGGIELVDKIEYGPSSNDLDLACDAPPKEVAEVRGSDVIMERSY